MTPHEQRVAMLEAIMKGDEVSIDALKAIIGMSVSTVRKRLNELAAMSLIDYYWQRAARSGWLKLISDEAAETLVTAFEAEPHFGSFKIRLESEGGHIVMRTNGDDEAATLLLNGEGIRWRERDEWLPKLQAEAVARKERERINNLPYDQRPDVIASRAEHEAWMTAQQIRHDAWRAQNDSMMVNLKALADALGVSFDD